MTFLLQEKRDHYHSDINSLPAREFVLRSSVGWDECKLDRSLHYLVALYMQVCFFSLNAQ